MRAGKAAQQAGGLQAGSSLLQEQAGRQAPDLHNQILTESSHNWQEGFSLFRNGRNGCNGFPVRGSSRFQPPDTGFTNRKKLELHSLVVRGVVNLMPSEKCPEQNPRKRLDLLIQS